MDLYLLDQIQRLRCGFLDAVMPVITALGNFGVLWIAAAIVMCAKKSTRRLGIMVFTGLLLDFIIGNMILKPMIARPRPCWINEVELLIAAPDDYSFPSGHTLASFTSAFIILHANRRIGFAAMVIAALIAFSRLYLYVHFPGDVLGGVLLAAGIAVIVCAADKRSRAVRKI